MQDLNKVYDISEFEKTFKKFMQETEFGTSVYSICYEKNIVMNYIPPAKMIELKKLVEENTLKLFNKIHNED